MRKQAQVVVIGGGILGCSLAYQLGRLGWHDTLLLEKDELTSGTTWHAAGNLILAESSLRVSRVNRLSWSIYEALERDTGQPIGHHRTGSIELATRAGKLPALRRLQRHAQCTGVALQMLDADEVEALCPLLDTRGVIAGAYIPDEGHVDPSQATQAFAHGARAAGVELARHTRVLGLSRASRLRPWTVTTDHGAVSAENVVIAAGFWSPGLAEMSGFDLPIVAVERQYLVTDALPELEQRAGRIPIIRDHNVPFYFRQEGKSLMFGVYEASTPFCFRDGVPDDFAHELLPHDLGRGEKFLAAGMRRVPVLARTGIRRVVCGPTSRTPDFQGLMGPLGAPGLFVLAGFSAGISQGAAAGRLLAEWMIEGQPSIDCAHLDVSRFGDWATPAYVRELVSTSRGYGTQSTEGEPSAGRPARSGPLHEALASRGAVFGARHGWECALWYAPPDRAPSPDTAAQALAGEQRATRTGVAIADLSALTRVEVSGDGAETFLADLCALPLPAPGQCGWNLATTASGKLGCAGTLARLDGTRFLLFAPAEAEQHHLHWLRNRAPVDGSVTVTNLSTTLAGVRLLGPGVSELLSRLPTSPPGRQLPAPGHVTRLCMGFAPTLLLRAGAPGTDTLDIHLPVESALAFHRLLERAAGRRGPRYVGLLALDALRVAAGLPAWGRELGSDVEPGELGLPARGAAAARRLCLLRTARSLPPPAPGASIFGGETIIGTVTSSAPVPQPPRNLALAFLPAALAAAGTRLGVEWGDHRTRATVVGTCASPAADSWKR